VADWVTISSLATAGGTLVLAVATFSSVRSANRSARVAELSLLAGLRPVLIPSREEDAPQRIAFGDQVVLNVPGHGGAVECRDGNVYLAIALRNGGRGLAVLHGWRVETDVPAPTDPNPLRLQRQPRLDDFRRQYRDLLIPAGDVGFWQGAIRDPNDRDHGPVSDALRTGRRLIVDLLYGDHEGGQRTIARFGISPWPDIEGERAEILRYFNIDRDDPR
jgi:hypothetical protein